MNSKRGRAILLTAQAIARRVAPMYKATNWRWQGVLVTEGMLIAKGVELLTDLFNSDSGITSITSGGLVAERQKDEQGTDKYVLSLFIPEYYEFWRSNV